MALSVAITLALAVILALPALIWVLRHSGDPGAKPKRPVKLSPAEERHAALLEARQRVERQIEILRTPVGVGGRNAPPDTRREMQELREVLAAINQKLEADAASGVKN